MVISSVIKNNSLDAQIVKCVDILNQITERDMSDSEISILEKNETSAIVRYTFSDIYSCVKEDVSLLKKIVSKVKISTESDPDNKYDSWVNLDLYINGDK